MTDNLLIQSENLEALKALEPTFGNQVQCIYIDPPYNTGEDRQTNRQGQSYIDRWSHDSWLEMMRERLLVLHSLLSPEGSIFIQIDDNEMDALKLLCDEIFGRQNFISRITVAARSPSSFSTVNPGVYKASEYLLWIASDRSTFRSYPLRVSKSPDRAYRLWLENPEDTWESWRLSRLADALPPGVDRDEFQVEHAHRVARLASISDRKASKATVALKKSSLVEPEKIFRVDRGTLPPQYLLRGQQLIFYDRQVTEIDGKRSASRPLTNIWTDISWEGIAREGGVTYKSGKKPERLLRRCLQLCTRPGDWVLDAFAGSGTTPAVAHKMGRQWVAIESGSIFPQTCGRLERVVQGEDPTGITKVSGWRGGGSFRRLEHPDSTCAFSARTQ